MKAILQLEYPPEIISQPVIFQLINRYAVSVNILRARVTGEEGWLILEMDGEAPDVHSAIDWLKDQGLTIRENPAMDT